MAFWSKGAIMILLFTGRLKLGKLVIKFRALQRLTIKLCKPMRRHLISLILYLAPYIWHFFNIILKPKIWPVYLTGKGNKLFLFSQQWTLVGVAKGKNMTIWPYIKKHTIISNGIAFINTLPIFSLKGWDLHMIR